MRYFDAFAGIGGFALGIQRAFMCYQNENLCGARSEIGNTDGQSEQLPEFGLEGLACVGFSEIDKYASSVYQRHFGGHKPYGDITKIRTADLPDFDILVGGFPCQAFSIAGRRGGFEDTRGTLFFELARILADKKPGYFCFENVKGLLSHDKGRTFKTIIETLDELGYDLQWQVLNSKHFGVPQNRERVFIVGNLRDRPRPQVFPIGNCDEENIVLPTVTTRVTADSNGSYVRVGQTQEGISNDIKIAGTLDEDGWEKRHESIRRVYDPNGLAPTIPTGTGGGVMPKILQTRSPQAEHIQDRVYKIEGISPAVNTFQPHNIKVEYESADNQPKVMQTSPALHGFEHGTNGQFNKQLVKGGMIRRLTPLECERLQAFPDNWTKYGKDDELISDTQRYKMCGNAVTVNVIEAIFRRLLEVQP